MAPVGPQLEDRGRGSERGRPPGRSWWATSTPACWTPPTPSYNLSDYDSLVAQAKAKAETPPDRKRRAAKGMARLFGAEGIPTTACVTSRFALEGHRAQFNVTWDGSVARHHRSAYEGRGPSHARLRPTGEAVSLTHRGRHCGEASRRTRQQQLLSGRGFLAQLGAESALSGGRFGSSPPRNRFPSAKGRAWGLLALSLRILPDSARSFERSIPFLTAVLSNFLWPL